MSTGLFFHTDLDGFYSALTVANQFELEPDLIMSVEYGKDYSKERDQLDELIILDYSENFGGEKTTLWVDHHIPGEGQIQAQNTVIGEAPSCVRLLSDRELISNLDEHSMSLIDVVDSASYEFDSTYTPEDLLFPTFKHEVDRYVVLNQLLRKNRKRGIAEKIFDSSVTDVDVFLYKIESETNPKVVKYNDWLQSKRDLVEKMVGNQDDFIQLYDGVPLLLTRQFDYEDWAGWDMNIFGYLMNESPFLIVAYEFNGGLSLQVFRNIFCPSEIQISDALKDLPYEQNGHETILNYRFSNKSDGAEALDLIISNLSEHL